MLAKRICAGLLLFCLMFAAAFGVGCGGALAEDAPEPVKYTPEKTWQPPDIRSLAKKNYEAIYIVRPRVDDNYQVVPGEYEIFERADITSNAEAARVYVQGAALREYELACVRRGSVFSNKAAGMLVAVTFDDGVFSKKTPKILEVLDKYNARATFFALGRYVQQHPELAKAVLEQGSELGSHSWYHSKQTTLSAAERAEDFALTAKAFTDAVGSAPYLFRAPYGAINDDIKKELAEQNMLSILWSVDTEDWRAKSADQVFNSVMRSVYPGAIILMHENGDYTLEALPRVLQALQDKGYQIVTISELVYAGSDIQAEAQAAAD